MPSDALLKGMNAVHRAILKASFGKIGWSGYGMPVLELTTTGRKSGQSRTVLLTSPWQDGDTIAIVASRGGDDIHPAWYWNIQADPSVQVKLQGQPTRPMRARVATPDERARIWPELTAEHKNYAGYQERTEREIPVVLLEPAG